MFTRYPIVCLFLGLWFVSSFTGCAKPVVVRGDQPPAISEMKVKSSAYKKHAAIRLKSLLTTAIGRQAETLLLETVIATIRDDMPNLVLLTPDAAGYPSFMNGHDPFAGPGEIFSVTDQARMAGYHFLIETSIVNIKPLEKRTGIWWFRKNRKFVTMVAAMDVYDTFTGSKVFSNAIEKTVNLDDASYDAYVSDFQTGISPVDQGIVDIAGELGGDAAHAMQDADWMASVIQVDGLQIMLSAGKTSGVKKGDKITVLGFSRVIESARGMRYRVPGYKVADAKVVKVDEATAQAALDETAQVKVGDIAVAVK